VLFLGQIVIFLATLAGVVACSLGMIFFFGKALNGAQTRNNRLRAGGLAFASLAGIVLSAWAGFFGVGAVMYLAQQN
jgi:hypothetical protein